MMAKIDEIISTFQSVDHDLRLQVLLDYARKLPELPPELAEAADRGEDESRVPECMTPVWLWVLPQNGHVRIYARVAEEAPTVRGVLSVIVHGYEGASPSEVAEMPQDLISRLGLAKLIRMNRAVGLNAIIQRVRRSAESIVSQGSQS